MRDIKKINFVSKRNCPLNLISTVLTIFISFLLLSQTLFPISLMKAETIEPNSYLIEFNSPSLIQQLKDDTKMNSSFFCSSIPNLLENISMIQTNTINKINQIIGENLYDRNIKLYKLIFNGLWVSDLPETYAKRIESLPFVKQVEKDDLIVHTTSSSPHSTTFKQYNPELNTSSNFSIDISQFSGNNISIAFFDTGIDYTHTNLASVYTGGYDFVNNNEDPFDDHGHGTHVTGITAAQPFTTSNGQQISGIAPNASVYAYKVLNEQGQGYTSWFLSAFEYAMDPDQDGNISDRVDIISISAGIPKGSASDLISMAAKQAVDAGITVVAAAGNDGPATNTISSPAIVPEVIAVGASIQNEMIAPYSSRGSPTQSSIKPDIIAPGHQIISTWPNNQFHILSGTSMATPYVTGIIACLLELNPSLNPNQIKSLLHAHAEPLGYNVTTEGYGLISTEKQYSTQVPLETNLSIHILKDEDSLLIDLAINNLQSKANLSIFMYPFDQQKTQDSLQRQQQVETKHNLIQIQTKMLLIGCYVLQIEIIHNATLTRLRRLIYLQKNTSDCNQSCVLLPNMIYESEEFTCALINTDQLRPNAFFIFYVPLQTIQIRIGSTVRFNAPTIPFSKKETISGTILTVIPSFPPQIEKNHIQIVNLDFD